jgi:hypothetical protein
LEAAFYNLTFEDEEDDGRDMCFMRLSPRLEKMRREGQRDIAAVIEDADQVATEFLSVFWGCLIEDSMFSTFSGRYRNLPWEADYPKNASQVIESIALEHQSESFDPNAWWNRFDDPTENPKRLLQELAVAGLLELDNLLSELAYRGNLWHAMRFQSSVFHWVTMVHAFVRERFIRSQSDIALVAAHARHAETRAMKQEVWEWYKANEQSYRSMDAAAEAIAGKIVPVAFRTARAWIGEYRKKMELIQSARRL